MNDIDGRLQFAVEQIVFAIGKLLKGKNPLLVALDGRSGTGKSTLAEAIARRVEGVVLVGDDFYAGGNDDVWAGLSPQEKVDRVIDWRRMRAEVLEPLLAERAASWHPLDFAPEVGWVGWKEEMVRVEPAPVILLDGAYSARPELADLIDLAVLVEAEDTARRKRLVQREGPEFMTRWHKLWDEAEEHYFSDVHLRASFDVIVRND